MPPRERPRLELRSSMERRAVTLPLWGFGIAPISIVYSLSAHNLRAIVYDLHVAELNLERRGEKLLSSTEGADSAGFAAHHGVPIHVGVDGQPLEFVVQLPKRQAG